MRPVVIAGVGAQTPLALGAMRTGFLLRAGLAAITESPLVDATEEPITACFVPTLDPLSVGAARVAVLAAGAAREALEALGEAAKGLRIKVVLCVDEHLARAEAPRATFAIAASGTPAYDVQAAVLAVARSMCASVKAEAPIARGSAGAGSALSEATATLGIGCDAVLLGGAHTDYDPAVVADLDARARIYREGNLDALIPGEAAAFVVLMRPEDARSRKLAVHAQIVSVATGYERATPDNDESAFEAAGLTVAVKKAGADVTGMGIVGAERRIGWVLTDMTFETRRMYEWQAVALRSRKLLGEPHHIDSPAQRIGHLGAASMPLHFALAAEAWRRRYAPSPIAMSIAGSDPGDRAAAILTAVTGS